ncbi:MAG TPA: hypothetical protein GX506_07435 [Firmicutes bacterium]|nr:hypothetical protein [Bacillota bacterium]
MKDRMVVMPISEQEMRLLTEIRKVEYGEATIYIRRGQPERIVKVKESIKLDENQ